MTAPVPSLPEINLKLLLPFTLIFRPVEASVNFSLEETQRSTGGFRNDERFYLIAGASYNCVAINRSNKIRTVRAFQKGASVLVGYVPPIKDGVPGTLHFTLVGDGPNDSVYVTTSSGSEMGVSSDPPLVIQAAPIPGANKHR